MLEVAVFPLPDLVAFPGQTIPLHIFEPRYRKMVQDCLKNSTPLGLACAAGRISKRAPHNLSAAEMLRTNQESYHANPILCLGQIAVKETLSDGRYIIDVQMTRRARIESMTQSLPYYEAKVIPLITTGREDPDGIQQLDRLKDLIAILLGNQFDSYQLRVEKIAKGNLEHLISQYIHTIRIDSRIQQQLLEEDHLPLRIAKFGDTVESYLAQIGTKLVEDDEDRLFFSEEDFPESENPPITPSAEKPAEKPLGAEVIPLFANPKAPPPKSP